MPSGAKKRRAAKKKRELTVNLESKSVEKSQDEETEVYVLPSCDENTSKPVASVSAKKSITAAVKMTQDTAGVNLNETDVNAFPESEEKTESASSILGLSAKEVHVGVEVSEDDADFYQKEGEDNVALTGDDRTSDSATSVFPELKVNEDISPAFEDRFLEFIEGSDLKKNKAIKNLESEDLSNAKEDDLVLGNNAVLDTPSADEIGLEDSSGSLLGEEDPRIIQTKPLLTDSCCVSCESEGGKILTTAVQINRIKKMLVELLLATDKLGEILKKLLDDLEAVQNNSDFGSSA